MIASKKLKVAKTCMVFLVHFFTLLIWESLINGCIKDICIFIDIIFSVIICDRLSSINKAIYNQAQSKIHAQT